MSLDPVNLSLKTPLQLSLQDSIVQHLFQGYIPQNTTIDYRKGIKMSTNGTNGIVDASSKKATHKFDPHFTQNVINATGPKASPRVRKVVASLIQHLHDFARENEITVEEWMAGVELV